VWPIVVIALLQFGPAASAQESTVQNLAWLKKVIIERLPSPGGVFRESLSQLFGLSGEVRVVKASEVVLADQHRSSLTFATNSEDVFLTDSRPTPDGVTMTLFHTDMALRLRAVASGATADSLQLKAADESTAGQFKEVIALWETQLQRLRERMSLASR
jgi:hypothetical protein